MLVLLLTMGSAIAQTNSSNTESDLVSSRPRGEVVASLVSSNTATAYTHESSLGWGQVVKSLGVVIALLGVLIGANLYIRRRAGQWKVSGGRKIHVVEQMAFDARRRLVLLEVCGRNVLLAVTPQQVNAISEWPKEESNSEAIAQ